MTSPLSRLAEKLGLSKPESDALDKFGKAVDHFGQKVEKALDDLTDAILFGRKHPDKGEEGLPGEEGGPNAGPAPGNEPGIIQKLMNSGWGIRGGLAALSPFLRGLAVPGAMTAAGLAAGKLHDQALDDQVAKGRLDAPTRESIDDADYNLDPVFGKGQYFSTLGKKKPGDPEPPKPEPRTRKTAAEMREERLKRQAEAEGKAAPEADGTGKVEYKADKIRFEAKTLTFKEKIGSPAPGAAPASPASPPPPAGAPGGPAPSFPGPSGSLRSPGGSPPGTPERPAGTPGGSTPSFPGPRGTPASPASLTAPAYGRNSPSQSQAQDSSTATQANPPTEVLARARGLLEKGANSGELQSFMAKQGYPMSEAWCGQFTASVVKSAGGTPPRGAAVASNWMNYGQAVNPSDVREGDIAVRKASRYGGLSHPGMTGSHVGIVVGSPKDGRFQLMGGNQARPVVGRGLGEYVYRRAPVGTATSPAAPPGAVQTQSPTVQSPQVKGFDLDQPPPPPRQPEVVTNTVTRNFFGTSPAAAGVAPEQPSGGPDFTDYLGVSN